MWQRALISVAVAYIMSSQQGSMGRKYYFPLSSTSYKTDKTSTSYFPTEETDTSNNLNNQWGNYPASKSTFSHVTLKENERLVIFSNKNDEEQKMKTYYPVKLPHPVEQTKMEHSSEKNARNDQKSSDPIYRRVTSQANPSGYGYRKTVQNSDISMPSPRPPISSSADYGHNSAQDSENSSSSSARRKHQMAKDMDTVTTSSDHTPGDISNGRLIEKDGQERICLRTTCLSNLQSPRPDMSYPDPCLLPSHYHLTLPSEDLGQEQLDKNEPTMVSFDFFEDHNPKKLLGTDYSYFRNPEHVMLNPSLPAGIPFNLEEKKIPRPKFNLSQAIVDGEVEVDSLNDPHLEELQILHKINKKKGRRRGRLFSIFSLVRFKNTDCAPSTTTSSSYTGTCYLASQCQEKGGENGGSCAGGFGVCCYFLANCGGTYSQNLTYWRKTSTTPCSINICKCQSEVCFIRLDFTSFDLHQPDSDLTLTTTLAGQCIQDMLTISSPGAPSVPRLCGINTGYHMYAEVQGTNCAQVTITQGTVVANREWDITISQIVCPDVSAPPLGCTQYFTGTSGNVYSFNYASTQHLANQDYKVCVRRESRYCSITWTAPRFSVSGQNLPLIPSAGVGDIVCTTDWVSLPDTGRYCGYAFPGPITSTVFPFELGVHTDSNELSAESGYNGFQMAYTQNAC